MGQAEVTMAARPFYLPVRGPAAQPGSGMKVPGLCVGSLARVHTMARTHVLFDERRASSWRQTVESASDRARRSNFSETLVRLLHHVRIVWETA